MKKEWYKSSWIKGILIVFTQVIAVILIISMVWIISCPRAAANVLKGDNVQYEDTQGFAETFMNQYADILAGLEAKEQFETDGEFDGDKIVDIQNVSNSQPIDGKNEHGLAYRLSDLIDWEEKIYDGDINSDQYGSSGENEILVCKKPDSTYEYYYFSDFKSKIDSGELKFINETEDHSSTSILQELQDGEYYEEDGDSLSFFDNVDDALKVFRAGNRMAKGTTTEYGLVGSYFANPFGPVQRQDQCEPLLQDYFQRMFDQGVKVGQLRTRLGIKGNEHNGPKEAATEILKYITGEKELKMLEDDE